MVKVLIADKLSEKAEKIFIDNSNRNHKRIAYYSNYETF